MGRKPNTVSRNFAAALTKLADLSGLGQNGYAVRFVRTVHNCPWIIDKYQPRISAQAFHNWCKTGITPDDPRQFTPLALFIRYGETLPGIAPTDVHDNEIDNLKQDLIKLPPDESVKKYSFLAQIARSGPDEVQTQTELQKLQKPFWAADRRRSDQRLYDFLESEAACSPPLYLGIPHRVMTKELEIGGRIRNIQIPVTVLTRARSVNLSRLPIPTSEDFDPAAKRDDYVQELEKISRLKHANTSARYFYNNRTYTMKDVSVAGDECTITGSISDYFSMLSTHDAMEFELLSRMTDSAPAQGGYDGFARRLQRRRRFLAKDNVVRRQHAALSVSALLVYKRKDGNYKIMVRKRSEDVAVHRGLLHVIPSGMFQPELSEEKEWNIQHCLIKEYSEELFSEEIAENAERPFYIYEAWESAKALYDALQSGLCKLLYSGLFLNLLTLRPHICCVLLVEDANWFEYQENECKNQKGERGFRSNWEFVTARDAMRSPGRIRTEYAFENIEAEIAGRACVPR
jgi:hypothetical protein